MGSSMAQGDEMAVWGRGLLKGYGKKEPEVLKHLNITVPRGSIYGLLGPSGCGKTTLLRCIVGRLSVDAGHLLVLGDRPGNPHHGVPGSMIGYMPQEMALFNKMTIGETLRYFGRVHGMGAGAIQDRTRFLLDFLSLPNEGRLVQSLSGGQKRRVSFSVALLHEPELLILDEPTVGVDPLLRERIWEHLISIAGTYGKEGTIIITTHYIEEARQATLVGLMRAGRLLAEESPTALLEKYKINSLETVFLQLCYEDSKQESQADSELTVTGTGVAMVTETGRAVVTQTGAVMETTPLLGSASRTPVLSNSGINSNYSDILTKTTGSRCRCSLSCPSAGNILAQFLKNLTLMKRNIGFLLFQFILPSIQIILFCVCIGRDPYDLHVALVNRDTPPMFYPPLGNMFIEHLDNYTVHKVAYTDLDAALQSVKHGDTWGVIYMGHNFTYDTVQRFTNMSHMTNDTVDGSTIKLYLDMTNQQISLVIQQKVLDAFEKLAESLLGSTGATLPIKVQEAVYGDLTPSFTNFMAPGVILSITFFMATGLTTLSFVIERKEGLLDRSLVSGMTSFEIMLAHVCTQLLVMAVQVLLLLVFALFVFHVPYKGPLIWVVILVLLQGLCGMTLGVIISVLCEEETSAIQLALGSVYPMLLMSGIIWPVEAIPEWMRYVSICLPMTYAGEAMRAILSKGWDVLHLQVWRGYLTTMAWSFGLLALAGLILRIKR